jgi:DNA-binding beta-propeller fold protein YncE
MTIADGNTVIHGSPIVGMGSPVGLVLYGRGENSLVVLDYTKERVMLLQDIKSTHMNATLIAHQWGSGSTLSTPYYLTLDPRNPSNVYVSNSGSNEVILIDSMQTVNPLPKVVAGITGSAGSTLNRLDLTRGITVDSRGNLYIADQNNHRVMRWTANATTGIVVIGQGGPTSDSMSLGSPKGLFLDENNSLLYVADSDNHRIQLFRLNETFSLNGTTVAEGNGLGSGSHQLNSPRAMRVSKKIGDMYIVDRSNHRIQKWQRCGTSGVTPAGSPFGIAGSDGTTLNNPYQCIRNSNETRMFVSDADNSRIQRFDLV